MGKLLYGSKVEVEMDDQTLLHLDVLLARFDVTYFQLHVGLGGKSDGNLLSLRVGGGIPLVMEYFNGPELRLDPRIIESATRNILDRGFVTIPFVFQRPSSEVDGN